MSRLSCVQCVCTHNPAFAANRKALTRTRTRTVTVTRSGVYAVIDKLTSQGFDMQFGTNVVGTEQHPFLSFLLPRPPLLPGHFYFTKLLIPVLTATAKDAPAGSVRVVNISSLGHYMTPPEGIQWSTLKPGDDYLALGKKIGALKLYGQSKLVKKTKKKPPVSSLDASRFSNLPRFIGQHPLLERTRKALRR